MGVGLAYSLLFTLFLIPLTVYSHNITTILSAFSEYSQLNNYLTQTKLADEINNRQPVTVLALDNGALSDIAAKHSLSVVKNVLSLHVLLDYYDAVKLHKIPNGSVLSTTLYQTTGLAGENLGFVNITDLRGGKVGFGSGVRGSALDSAYTKEVKKVPYSLSVVEISQPIIATAIMTAPASSASEVNITALLIKAGCNTFASYILSTGVAKVYQANADKGLTVFAPSDEAFKAKGLPNLEKLTKAELVSLLQYHALASYSPVGTLKSTKAPMTTLATGRAGKYQLGVTTAGDEVTLHAGLDSSRVARTVLDTTPLCLYTVDSVLLPAELFGVAPATAPTTAPATAPAAEAPAPVVPPGVSPSAPPSESPENAPADAPTEAADSSSKNSAVGVEVSSALVTAAGAVVLLLFLG